MENTSTSLQQQGFLVNETGCCWDEKVAGMVHIRIDSVVIVSQRACGGCGRKERHQRSLKSF